MTPSRPRTIGRRLLVDVGGALCAVIVSGAILVAPVEPVSPVVEASAQRFVESELWLAPNVDPVIPSDIARGAALLEEGQASQAMTFLSRGLADPVLGPYARLYVGRAQLALERYADAAASAREIIKTAPGGALGESALWVLAEAIDGREAWDEAVPVWQTIAGVSSPRLSEALLRLAHAAEKAREPEVARTAYSRIYYEFPASGEADAATRALARPGVTVIGGDPAMLEIGRADRLFAARRFTEARRAYESVRATAPAVERPRVVLRTAQADYQLQKYAAARDAFRAIIAQAGGRHPEAEFYLLGTLRGLKRDAEYLSAVTSFAAAYPTSTLAETALNDLATYHILANDDAQAAAVFTEMYAKFPTGAFADRAAWKAGWWAYRTDNYRETIRLFESAASTMRRADYRPSWLYWAARAHDELGEREAAKAGYRQTIVFYRNSYYGREAARALARIEGPPVSLAAARNPGLVLTPGPAPANAPLIRSLLVAGLFSDAIAELRKVQAESGTSPVIEATIGYALSRRGELRPGITALRRAYPQFMAEGGEELPDRILRTIFPVAHWDLIARYAQQRGIDQFLLTALVAQESTFQADVRSVANAWGLMQLLPSTGRRYATKTNLRGFTPARLTDPETNVRLGTAYLSDLLTMFGDAAPALAAYNAGEHRVIRWKADRPGLPRDEFIDDIPFPETQNYVKRILGTAEDYKILYGHLATERR